MLKKGNKKHNEDHMDESWLIPYADILTLLLALFIVLFSMSEIDAKKFAEMAESLNNILEGGESVMESPSSLPLDQMQSSKADDAQNKPKEEAPTEKLELQELQNKMDDYIKEKDLDAKLKTTLVDEGLMLTVLDDAFFDSGSAIVREEDYDLAKEISSLLVMETDREIVVSGHSDNVPIHNNEFESNWELSVMRAVNFMKILLVNNELDPMLFSAKGFGEFKPIASNNTVEGRKMNRRVEVLIKTNL